MVTMSGHRRRRAAPSDESAAVLRRLWGRTSASPRGRRPELDVQQVVAAAVAIADRDGVESVSLPKVARALGYTTMALYRHIGSKDELLLLMQDHASGEPPVIESPSWRAGLEHWAGAQRAVLRQHPWLARLPVTGPPAGPRQVAWMEAGLHALAGTSLDWADKLGVLMLIGGYVRQATLLAQDLGGGRERSSRASQAAERRYGRAMQPLIDPQRYPETTRLLASGLFERPHATRDRSHADLDFRFGLGCILDGVDAVIGRVAAGAAPRARSRETSGD
jgi:AcrR family transcriptional regulator